MKYNIYILAVVVIGFGIVSCKKTGADSGIKINAAAPTITTSDATNINGTNATIGGSISTDGGSMVKEAGVVYSTSPNVDTTKTRIRKYSIGGDYTVGLTGLSLLTTYYYRAYAINEKGITYGAEKSFFVPIAGYSTSSQVAAANLVAYWAFNGGYIDSVSRTVGTPMNATGISFVTGKLGQAVQVKNRGYINSNVTNTIANLKSFTMVMWIQQPTSLANSPTTFMPFSLNAAGYSWEQTKFFMLFDQPDNTTNTLGKIALMDQWFDKGKVWPRMLDGNWHQMAISYDGTSGAMRVYVDGTLLPQSNAFSINPQNNFGTADSFTLGGPNDATNTANGWMNSLSGNLDEFRVFNKVLTPDEILILYTLQNKGF
ncbi:MAG TPA: LamG-like jellyroll fold domain-containing protein [Flavisolibacter sp.]|nr:LamG-like jellyroll fold domain-containing protein [Flavisolibacter sp.]